MKIGQPLVLLLGGLLSASSVGCSAVSALVRDDRPAAGASQAAGSAERLVSIGRVFENQGRYDQAEVMYRRALKKKPNDPIIRQQIAALVERRNGRTPGDPMQSAIAAADALNGRRSTAKRNTQAEPASDEATEAVARLAGESAEKPIVQTSKTILDQASARVTKASESVAEKSEKTFDSAVTVKDQAQAKSIEFESAVAAARIAVADVTEKTESAESEVVTSFENVGEEITEFEKAEFEAALSGPSATEVTAATSITREQVLAVIDSPGSNHKLLLSALNHGDSEETRCLAATLLGECDSSNSEIRTALATACSESTEERLTLSCIDSQIQRGEADQSSAVKLIALLKSESTDVQAQAAASLRCFTGSEAHKDCTAALVKELSNPNADVRAIAALTLGDFPVLEQAAREALEKLAASDPDSDVREAAQAAILRGSKSLETTHAMVILPR